MPEPGAQYLAGPRPAVDGGDDTCGRVETGERRPQPVGRLLVDEVEFVEDDDVGELDLRLRRLDVV